MLITRVRVGVQGQALVQLLEEALGLVQVLDDVQQEDVVEVLELEVGKPVVEVVQVELVELDAVREREEVDAHHVAPTLPQRGADRAAGAPEVEDARAGPDGRDRQRVRALVPELGLVLVVVAAPDVELALVQEAEVLRARLQRRARHVRGVLHAVDVADLVAVVRRDRHLADPLPGVEELDDDLGVEVEVVRVQVERDRAERLRRVHAVAGVELAEVRPEQLVLEAAQDLVPDELVERHAAAEGASLGHHPGAEHGVGLAVAERAYEIGEALRRVLPVAVDERDVVEALLDRVVEPELLVAAVALVHRVEEDVEREGEHVRLPDHLAPVEGGVLR